MKLLADEIVKRGAAGESVVLCTIVATKGSTPQARGAKMLVLADGNTVGTLGGGCVEAEVRKRALSQLPAGGSETARFSLDHDYGWDDGLICGGIMDVHMRVVRPQDLPAFQQIANALAQERSTCLQFDYTLEGRELKYVEDMGPPPVLLIAGAGHVGQALAKLAADLEFRVDVIDDRADLMTADRFPSARQRILGDIETELRKYPVDAATFVIIVTRGHKNDGRALAAVVNSPAKYVGLIGSKRKIKAIFDDLSAQGVALEKLLAVHAPIGLEIGSVTVAEIAISIAAELVAVRRGRGNMAAAPMKMDGESMRKWLSRSNRNQNPGSMPS